MKAAFAVSLDGVEDDGRELSPQEVEHILRTMPKKKPRTKLSVPQKNKLVEKHGQRCAQAIERKSNVLAHQAPPPRPSPAAPHLLQSVIDLINPQAENLLLKLENGVSHREVTDTLIPFALSAVSGVYFLINDLVEVEDLFIKRLNPILNKTHGDFT